jgi:PKHD-type hydroxylase
MFQYGYWIWKKGLSPQVCDYIINEVPKDKLLLGGISDGKLNKTIRNSDIFWLRKRWIYNEVLPFVREANIKAGWNFQYDTQEEFQFTTYGEGKFYDWHMDTDSKPYKTGDLKGKMRKLSVTISLSDGKDYDGGDFELDFRNTSPNKTNRLILKELRNKGSLVVFPSFIWHKVHPVTRGKRLSLVLWNNGEPFK